MDFEQSGMDNSATYRFSGRLRMSPRSSIFGAIDLLLHTINTTTRVQIRTAGAPNVNVLEVDVATDSGAGALQVADERVVFLAGSALEVPDGDIRNGQVGRGGVAQGNVLLAVALRYLNGVVDVVDGHAVVSHVGHFAQAAAAHQIAGHGSLGARPDFDACAIGRVGHADVGNLVLVSLNSFNRPHLDLRRCS
jgi:hypothetical protein